MEQVVRRAGSIALAVLIAAAASACGSSGPDAPAGPPSGASAPGPVERPYASAQQAAFRFSSWFDADAADCGEPDFVLDGRLPPAMLDGYSCREVLTAAEVAHHCKRSGWGARVAPGTRPVVLSPTRQRVTVAWNSGIQCPGVPDRRQAGTFRVVVEKHGDGWSVASYKILTGPGAGASG